MFYKDWGFKANPFETHPLGPNEEGRKLLTGRDQLLEKIYRRLSSSTKIPVVEGMNGAGKTSLVNVALFQAYEEYRTSSIGPFLVPCRTSFQLNADEERSVFHRKALLEVAQTLIEKRSELAPQPGRVRQNIPRGIEKLMNSPTFSTVSGMLSGFGGGFSETPNSSFAFAESGFERMVSSWLKEVFPSPAHGAVVCVLDNLEVLRTSKVARETLEAFRDTLFDTPGIRWVLCGASGITHGIATSVRLHGRLHSPIEIENLEDRFSGDVYDTRIRFFKEARYARLPISRSNFVEIFDIMRGNLRAALSEADDFCNWVADRCESQDEFSDHLFEEWLEEELTTCYDSVRPELTPKSWEVFEIACQLEAFSPNDFDLFGYSEAGNLNYFIKSLEAAGLLAKSADESDRRKRTISVTSKGWKVRSFLDFNSES